MAKSPKQYHGRTSVSFVGECQEPRTRRGIERFLVRVAGQQVWLIKSHFRIMFQLGLRRAYTDKHEIGWMHEDTIVPGGSDMASYVHKIRKELTNRGLPPHLIQSNGDHHWRMHTERFKIYFNYPNLVESLDDDLREDLLTYREVAKERQIEKEAEERRKLDATGPTESTAAINN